MEFLDFWICLRLRVQTKGRPSPARLPPVEVYFLVSPFSFNKGLLDEFFIQLEETEDDERNPNFVESIINLYFSDGTREVQALGEELTRTPLNRDVVYRYLYHLKCSSASFGARKVVEKVDDMRKFFNDNNIEGLKAAYPPMKDEHFALRRRMLPYGELLHLLKQEPSPPPPEASSANNDDIESIGSNDPMSQDQ
ncbi:hypothetical protein Dimus_003326 [Dionaea muscipula]